MNIEKIEAIAPDDADRLAKAGIYTAENLLNRGASPEGRAFLSAKTGINSAKIVRWVNMADLYRVRGLDQDYSELLEAAGVETLRELAMRNAVMLQRKLNQLNKRMQLAASPPNLGQVENWVDTARNLERVITY